MCSMERIQLTEDNIEECVVRAAEVLRAGGVVLYPTDTLYGLGANALSDATVDTIYEIKGRDEKKPIHALVSDAEMIERYAELDGRARMLISKHLPGPLTLVLRKKSHVSSGIARLGDTMGFRIPANAFCLGLAKRFDAAITTTSANMAGEISACSVDEILAQLGTTKIDLVIDAGVLPERLASTVVDISGDEMLVLREGAISRAEIERALYSDGAV